MSIKPKGIDLSGLIVKTNTLPSFTVKSFDATILDINNYSRNAQPTNSLKNVTLNMLRTIATISNSYPLTTTSNGYLYYQFTSSGSIQFSSNVTCPVLIVAGGGGGGFGITTYEGAGGGGAGGVGYGNLTFVSGTTYTITVGNGGVGGINSNGSTFSKGTSGSNSSIVGGSINEVANGGGYGGSNYSSATYWGGGNGGSGGGTGTGWGGGNAGTSTPGNGTLTYLGNSGAKGAVLGAGGSGGGATGAGVTPSSATVAGGVGGAGYTWSSNGYSITVGGGGGGGGAGTSYSSTSGGAGGAGGGGGGGSLSTSVTGINGKSNTGGGGGGACGQAGNGGNGGSGTVIIGIPTSYSITTSLSTMFVSYTGSYTVTSASPYNVYILKSSGTLVLNGAINVYYCIIGGGSSTGCNTSGAQPGGAGGGVTSGKITQTTVTSYNIVVGAGGSAQGTLNGNTTSGPVYYSGVPLNQSYGFNGGTSSITYGSTTLSASGGSTNYSGGSTFYSATTPGTASLGLTGVPNVSESGTPKGGSAAGSDLVDTGYQITIGNASQYVGKFCGGGGGGNASATSGSRGTYGGGGGGTSGVSFAQTGLENSGGGAGGERSAVITICPNGGSGVVIVFF